MIRITMRQLKSFVILKKGNLVEINFFIVCNDYYYFILLMSLMCLVLYFCVVI